MNDPLKIGGEAWGPPKCRVRHCDNCMAVIIQGIILISGWGLNLNLDHITD